MALARKIGSIIENKCYPGVLNEIYKSSKLVEINDLPRCLLLVITGLATNPLKQPDYCNGQNKYHETCKKIEM